MARPRPLLLARDGLAALALLAAAPAPAPLPSAPPLDVDGVLELVEVLDRAELHPLRSNDPAPGSVSDPAELVLRLAGRARVELEGRSADALYLAVGARADFPVRVPERARLSFAAAAPLGPVELSLEAWRGEERWVLWRRPLDPDDGWERVSLPLAPLGGGVVTLRFAALRGDEPGRDSASPAAPGLAVWGDPAVVAPGSALATALAGRAPR